MPLTKESQLSFMLRATTSRRRRRRTSVIEKDGNVLVAKEAIDLFDVVLNNEIKRGQETRRILFQKKRVSPPRFGILFRNLEIQQVFLFFFRCRFSHRHLERIIISEEGILGFVLVSSTMERAFNIVRLE